MIKMLMKKRVVLGIMFLFVMLIVFSLVSAQEVSYCCEKTIDDLDDEAPGIQGGWCVNAPQDKCDPSKRAIPTSCEATSYCKTGTCVNTAEGICFENTPRKTCVNPEGGESGGVWYDSDSDEIPLCQLGCCLIGDQAAFVTQTRCQKLSSYYGLEINFRTDIKDELTCIASATPKAKGACVFETSTGRTCTFITKSECQDMKAGNPSANFHQGLLCSNPSLGADCSSSSKTTCVEGRDEVYFLDTCGNLANVYDSRYAEPESSDTARRYWSEVQAPECNLETPGQGPANCGNCNYYFGTTCGEFRRGTDESPIVGNYVCRDLGCTYENDDKNHGETWCATGENPGISGSSFSSFSKRGNFPGSRDFRLICYNGEVTVEPCADFRQEICIQGEVGTFSTAICRANLWRDCFVQDNEKDCENKDKRDCRWLKGIGILADDNGEELEGSCVPEYSPGFDFWEEGTDAEDVCSMASTTCLVKYEGGEVVDYEERGGWGFLPFASGRRTGNETWVCLDDDGEFVEDWAENRKNLCSSLGDCGISKNYVNVDGYYDEDDLFTITEGKEE